MRKNISLCCSTALAIVCTAALLSPTATAAQRGEVLGEGGADSVQNSYIVVFKDLATQPSAIRERAESLASRYEGVVEHIYRVAVKGFSATMSPVQAKRLAADSSVSYVEQNRVVRGTQADQINPPWGLDRVDQADLPLNNRYSSSTEASNVTAYVIDTGINYDHADFGGRASPGFDAFSDGRNGRDCQGHGTHVAGTIGGTRFGVAKGVRLKAVRVFDCQSNSSLAALVAGFDWVTANAVRPAVANASLHTGRPNDPSRAVDDAVRASIRAGITYVVSASNTADDSCRYSPPRVTEMINVAATTRTDARRRSSSYGRCVDLFAPGEDIISASHSSNTGTQLASGTSMAAPHVAGAVALHLSANPAATPAAVHNAIVASATPNKVTDPGAGTPNRLLRTR
ncbi:S8 family peptidase [Lentzea sp. JNUCC 0626]|uniref:S8 family peptidase n=1 Tax=Lentzea sp. JNUCC 0626 TaxID=3367513 RepID=UPI003748A53D